MFHNIALKGVPVVGIMRDFNLIMNSYDLQVHCLLLTIDSHTWCKQLI